MIGAYAGDRYGPPRHADYDERGAYFDNSYSSSSSPNESYGRIERTYDEFGSHYDNDNYGARRNPWGGWSGPPGLTRFSRTISQRPNQPKRIMHVQTWGTYRGTSNPFGPNRGISNNWSRGNSMPPSRVFSAVQDMVENQSMFYATFQCPEKVGKYICKIKCVERDEKLTGICEAGYCTCILKQQKKLRKQLTKRFMAAMNGYDTDCSAYKKVKHCKRFCKALTPDKTFTGMCKDNHCQCITYPKLPEAKKTACRKAINKLKQFEDRALKHLGIKPIPLAAYTEKQVTAATDEAIKRLKANNSMDSCTGEDINNLRGIILSLSQGFNALRGDQGFAETPAPAAIISVKPPSASPGNAETPSATISIKP